MDGPVQVSGGWWAGSRKQSLPVQQSLQVRVQLLNLMLTVRCFHSAQTSTWR